VLAKLWVWVPQEGGISRREVRLFGQEWPEGGALMPMNPRVGRPQPEAAPTPKTTYNLITRTLATLKTRSGDQIVLRY